VRSYRDFCRDARVHDFGTEDLRVDVVADTAVASYRFRIDYEYGGHRLQEEGREVQVMVREAGAWRSVWRTILPGPDPDGDLSSG
jgi:ketosteroid isomerase-like protein